MGKSDAILRLHVLIEGTQQIFTARGLISNFAIVCRLQMTSLLVTINLMFAFSCLSVFFFFIKKVFLVFSAAPPNPVYLLTECLHHLPIKQTPIR